MLTSIILYKPQVAKLLNVAYVYIILLCAHVYYPCIINILIMHITHNRCLAAVIWHLFILCGCGINNTLLYFYFTYIYSSPWIHTLKYFWILFRICRNIRFWMLFRGVWYPARRDPCRPTRGCILLCGDIQWRRHVAFLFIWYLLIFFSRSDRCRPTQDFILLCGDILWRRPVTFLFSEIC